MGMRGVVWCGEGTGGGGRGGLEALRRPWSFLVRTPLSLTFLFSRLTCVRFLIAVIRNEAKEKIRKAAQDQAGSTSPDKKCSLISRRS